MHAYVVISRNNSVFQSSDTRQSYEDDNYSINMNIHNNPSQDQYIDNIFLPSPEIKQSKMGTTLQLRLFFNLKVEP